MARVTASNVSRSKPAAQAMEQDLRALTSFQLRQLANMYTKGTASVYERKFGLTLNEWRLIALLHASSELSLNRLAEQAQFDRGLTSRIVQALADRGFVDRRADSRDARGVAISLTEQGRELVGRIFPEALARNEQLLSCLTKNEREVLQKALQKLTVQARIMLDKEAEQADDSSE